jgi:hypothetical protein
MYKQCQRGGNIRVTWAVNTQCGLKALGMGTSVAVDGDRKDGHAGRVAQVVQPPV